MRDGNFDAEIQSFIAQVCSLEAERDHLQAQNAALRSKLQNMIEGCNFAESTGVATITVDSVRRQLMDALAAAEKAKPE